MPHAAKRVRSVGGRKLKRGGSGTNAVPKATAIGERCCCPTFRSGGKQRPRLSMYELRCLAAAALGASPHGCLESVVSALEPDAGWPGASALVSSKAALHNYDAENLKGTLPAQQSLVKWNGKGPGAVSRRPALCTSSPLSTARLSLRCGHGAH